MSIQETNLKAIADAIRAKTGLTGTIKASEFASKIAEIKTGSPMGFILSTKTNGGLNCNCLTYGKGKFIGISSNISNDSLTYSKALIITSDNNISYVDMPVKSVDWTIAFGNGVFVAGGYYSAPIYWSTNGYSWTEATLDYSYSWFAAKIIYVNNKFVMLCRAGQIMTSSDGKTWTKVGSAGDTAGTWSDIIYAQNKYIAIDSYGASYSTDLISWTRAIENTNDAPFWYWLTYFKGKIIAMSQHETMVSVDGINWSTPKQLDPNNYPLGGPLVTVNDKLYMFNFNGISGQYAGLNAVSEDGINWSEYRTSWTMGFCCAVYANGNLVLGSKDDGYVINYPDFL